MSFGRRVSNLYLAEFIVNMWEIRKQKQYGNDGCPNQLHSQSSPGGLVGIAGVGGQMLDEGKLNCVYYRVTCDMCVGACACECACKCDNVHTCMYMYA